MALKFLNNGYFAGKVGIGVETPTYTLELQVSQPDENPVVYSQFGGNNGVTGNSFLQIGGARGSAADERYSYLQTLDGAGGFRILSLNPSGGNVGIGTNNPDRKLHVNSGSDNANTIFESTDTAVTIRLKDLTGSAEIESRNDFRFSNNAGVDQRMVISTTGAIKFNNYNSTNNTGTPTYMLGTDASGNVVKVLGSGIPGVPAGSGTLNTVPLWTPDGDTLGNSNITQSTSLANDIIIPQYVRHTSDTNTYFGFGLNDTVNFGTAGSERMRIDSSGNVGIGTTNPAVRLDFGNATGKAFHLYTSGTDYYGFNMLQYDSGPFSTNIFSGNGGEIKLRTVTGSTSAVTRLTVKAGGNVGIGTTNPGRPLHVIGQVAIANAVDANSTGALLVSCDSTSNKIYSRTVQNSTGAHPIDFIQTFSTVMRIASNGNVGIGTTSPGHRLDVTTSDASTWAVALKNTNANGYGLFVQGSETTNRAILAAYSGSSYKLWVRGDGNVGIGTTAPSQKLHVAGNARVTGAYYDSNNSPGTANQVLVSTVTGTDWIDGSAIPGVPAGSGTLNTVTMWTPDGDTLGDGPITFNGNNSTLLGIVQCNSELGVGSAPTNTFSILSGSGQVNMEFGTDSTSTFIQAYNRTNSVYGALRFVTNGETMRITNTGNVGIGTTGPSYLLDVNGDARSKHFRDNAQGSGSTPATIGWYKIAKWDGSARGGSEIKISTTGGNYTPITWIIRCYKNWSGDATLKLEQYGYSNIYFTKVRVEYDNTAAVYYLEIYQSIATALAFNMYQTSLMGFNSNVSILTGALAAGTTGGTTRTELPFIAGGTSVEAFTIGNSGNTGPYLPLAGGTMTGNTVHNDNVKSIYGTASDGLEIYHDGTDSIIADTGTGNLYIRGAASMRLQGINQSNFFIATQGGSANLYYNNANKLDTTNTGINVTGDIRLNTKALLSNQENTDVDTGTETVASVAIATYTAAFFDFVIKKTTNVRSGTVYACHDGTNVEFTETSTQDLGDTSDVTLSVDISGTDMRLRATTTSDDWSIKSLIRAI